MGAFESTKSWPIAVADLSPVVEDLQSSFKNRGFEVTAQETAIKGWRVSIHKGGLFKMVMGMKTALTVDINPSAQGVEAKAGVGIFGLQAVPTAIMLFIAWPVLLTQIWGLIQQSRLDDEALDCVERSLMLLSTAPAQAPTAHYCTYCGATLQELAQFCSRCGKAVS